MHRNRSRTAALSLTPLALLALSIVPTSAPASPGVAQVDVYDRTQRAALEVYRKFEQRWISGEPGHEYAVRVRNCSGVRVLAVISVDGVNVITGETASTTQSGYVIEPGDYVNVEGWRKNLERTAAFVFTDPSASYAARTGRPDDLGVIGVALFRERETRPQSFGLLGSRQESSSGAAAAPAADSAAKASAENAQRAPSLGTGHGRNEASPAQWTHFDRASEQPDETISIRYETRDALLAMGVLPQPWLARRDPSPFPASRGFVPDP